MVGGGLNNIFYCTLNLRGAVTGSRGHANDVLINSRAIESNFSSGPLDVRLLLLTAFTPKQTPKAVQ